LVHRGKAGTAEKRTGCKAIRQPSLSGRPAWPAGRWRGWSARGPWRCASTARRPDLGVGARLGARRAGNKRPARAVTPIDNLSVPGSSLGW